MEKTVSDRGKFTEPSDLTSDLCDTRYWSPASIYSRNFIDIFILLRRYVKDISRFLSYEQSNLGKKMFGS